MTTPRSRDADLLFGVLALQMNFLSKDRFLECAAVWMSGPGKDLGAMFLERGYLTAKQHGAVAAMVEAQVEASGGDARKSLSASRIDRDIVGSILEMDPPADVKKTLAGRRSEAALPGTAPAAKARYRMGEILGAGGLGKVLLAFDQGLDREVAMKMVLDATSGDTRGRFEREAKLAGRLEHPNIVPVYDYGTLPEGELFLTMRRIRGKDLGKILQLILEGDADTRRSWTRAKLLMAFQGVCLGMAFSHDRGVIHRDLKPANVMIGAFGEVLIVDWGLARVLSAPGPEPDPGSSRVADSADSALTMDGDVMGTPAYMPPEQAEGRIADLDHRSDVYSLGAILYEILTLRAPFEGRSARDILTQVRSGKITPPSSRIEESVVASAPGAPEGRVSLVAAPSSRAMSAPVPPELDAICLKALAFNREDRHQSALELHDDVQQFLEGVTELDRKRRQGAEWVRRGQEHLKRFQDLRPEVDALTASVRSRRSAMADHEPLEVKRKLWADEEKLRQLREERIETYSGATAEFGHALAVDRGAEEAADGLCELSMERYVEAEAAKDREGMLLHRRALEVHDRRGDFRKKLDTPGALTLRVFSWKCRCLEPLRVPGRTITFASDAKLLWTDGRTRPGEPLGDWTEPVPEARVEPPEPAYGHTDACRREEVRGAKVRIAQIVEREHLLVEDEWMDAGESPLEAIELPQGSFVASVEAPGFRASRFPFIVRRGETWSQDASVFRDVEIPAGFVLVPGGPFTHAGHEGGGRDEEIRVVGDYFIAERPTTIGEYAEFLEALSAAGREDEAKARLPKEGGGTNILLDGGKIRFQGNVAGTQTPWSPGLPLIRVTWHDAMAYVAWRGARDGRFYTLPHEFEFEKAARGVDGRVFPYGNRYDGNFSHTNSSFAGGLRFLEVDAFPKDVSPYGVRGLGGCAGTWCQNAITGTFAGMREWKGGSWSDVYLHARSASRLIANPGETSRQVGIRLVMPVFRYC